MKFNSDEIASVIQKEIETFESQMDVREVGTVLEVSDGIAQWMYSDQHCRIRCTKQMSKNVSVLAIMPMKSSTQCHLLN